MGFFCDIIWNLCTLYVSFNVFPFILYTDQKIEHNFHSLLPTIAIPEDPVFLSKAVYIPAIAVSHAVGL